MIEREFKCLVSPVSFCNFKYYISKKYRVLTPELIVQTNYYYDTPDFTLGKKNITLRIRQTGTELKLQRKSRLTQDGSCVESEETETPVPAIPRVISGNSAGTKDDVYLLGKLETKRLRYRISEDVTVDLDQNTYLGMTDYEIEIEYKDRLPDEFAICRYLEAPEAVTGKYTRFLSRYMRNCIDERYRNIG